MHGANQNLGDAAVLYAFEVTHDFVQYHHDHQPLATNPAMADDEQSKAFDVVVGQAHKK